MMGVLLVIAVPVERAFCTAFQLPAFADELLFKPPPCCI